ncbi:MAG: GUN4 domain-containing protein [Cyanobacteria bacterium P01_F01_bin.153]
MTLSQCPICNAEAADNATPERCSTCGWYLESLSIPMTEAMAQFLASREEIQITWARDMWQKVQLQEDLESMGRDMSLMVRQLRRAHKERSQLYAQVLELRELAEEQAAQINEAVLKPATNQDTAAEPTPEAEGNNAENNGRSNGESSNGTATNGSLSPSSEATLLAALHTLQRQVQQQSVLIRNLPHTPGTAPLSAPPFNGEVAKGAAVAGNNGEITPIDDAPFSDSPFDDDLELTDLAIATDAASGTEDAEPGNDETNETSADSSKAGVSYRKLHKLLAAGKWNDADRETTRLMLKVAGRSSTSWLRIEDIENFPAADLQAIDRLWVAYSQDQFGFSVQKKLWLDVADDSTSQVEAWCQFGDLLGWLSKKKVGTGLNAPTGHLPSCSSVGVWWSSGLFPQVLEGCEL